MTDLAALFSSWLFSSAGAGNVVGLAALLAAAILCSQTRSTGRFILIAGAIWVAASAVAAANSSSPRSAVASTLWCFSLVALNASVLGVLVGEGKRPRTLLIASLLLFLVQLPFSLLSGLLIGCYVGHECP